MFFMADFIKIGLIAKPHGVRGEVKVNPFTDDLNRFFDLKKCIVDGVNYKVLGAKISSGQAILRLDGITDRDSAEGLRGKFISVNREDAVPLSEDSFFIDDIIGCSVFADDELVGKIVDVTTAKTDIFTVKTVDDRILRFPFLKDLLISVRVAEKKVLVKKQRLLEVSCYEN